MRYIMQIMRFITLSMLPLILIGSNCNSMEPFTTKELQNNNFMNKNQNIEKVLGKGINLKLNYTLDEKWDISNKEVVCYTEPSLYSLANKVDDMTFKVNRMFVGNYKDIEQYNNEYNKVTVKICNSKFIVDEEDRESLNIKNEDEIVILKYQNEFYLAVMRYDGNKYILYGLDEDGDYNILASDLIDGTNGKPKPRVHHIMEDMSNIDCDNLYQSQIFTRKKGI